MTDTKSLVTPELRKQVNTFIDSLEGFNEKRKKVGFRDRHSEDYQFLRDFFLRFFADRNKRADEVSQKKYSEVIILAHKLIPVPTLWNVCVDGRVLVILMIGGSAKIGSSIRTPGGILPEFVFGKDGKMKLLENSHFAHSLDAMLIKFDVITEAFDSHVGCAARGAEELAKGRSFSDSGLMSDVLDKKDMIIAMQKYVKQRYGNTKKVIALQTSFDPHSGYMYMGLESSDALFYAKLHADEKTGDAVGTEHTVLSEYSDEILDALVKQEMIISTQELVAEPEINTLFAKHAFSIHWQTDYVQSATKFWEGIAALKNKVLPIIEKKLLRIYPELKSDDQLTQKELQERAIILLANAFSGYLNNHYKTYHQKKDEQIDDGHYLYGSHTEEGVWVSIGGNSPYAIPMFGVSPEVHLAANVVFSASIVRANRFAERVIDRSGIFVHPKQFAKTPVPVVAQEVVREPVSDEEWEKFSKIGWADLPEDWDKMESVSFMDYLLHKGVSNSFIMLAINNLRNRMALLFDPDSPTSAHMVRNHEVAVPVIAGKNRYNHFIVPFVKLGY